MSEDDLPDLSERQEQVLARLPASKKALAEAFDVAPTTIEGHLYAIQDKGVDLEWDRDANEWFIADNRSARLRSLSTRHKQTITREVSERIEEEQAYLFRRLRRTDPIQADPVQDADHESFGVILGDLHFGDVVEKEYWDDDAGEYQTVRVYDSKIAAEKVATFGEKLLRIRELMASVATFDDCYLFLLGDISTGMHVYDGQVHHIDAPLKDQVEESVGALFQLVRTLAEEFTTVQVRGVPGNHGTDKPSAAIGANTDLLTYGWLDDRLRDIGLSNVDFRTAETHHHLNTTVRDWRYHIRHGDDEREHVDETAASARDWRGLQDEFEFDVAMKGHHHSPAFHKVMNEYPVFSAPSPKPGGEFPSKIGKPDVSRHSDLGWVFGVSDTRPVTWQFLLDDR
jgi:predicted phosphodiesterase